MLKKNVATKRHRLKNTILNVIGYNIAWFGLVYWGNAFIPVALVLLLSHFLFISKLNNELMFVILIASLGCMVDFSLQSTGFFIFPTTSLTPLWFTPLWLIVLWFCFACTINHSLNFLSSSKWLQLIAGGIFAPLSYLAGVKLNAVDLGQSLLSTYIVLSVIWGILFIIFYRVKEVSNVSDCQRSHEINFNFNHLSTLGSGVECRRSNNHQQVKEN